MLVRAARGVSCMKIIQRVLLAQRSDGKLLRLSGGVNTTSHDYVDDPVLANRTKPYDSADLVTPKPAAYYFENSSRARDTWLKDCKMVAYEITTIVAAIALTAENIGENQ